MSVLAEPRVVDDPDDGLPVWERNKASLHRDIDAICRVWPHALTDYQAIGFRSHPYDSAGGQSGFVVKDEYGNDEFVPATGVEMAALGSPSPAVAWLAEMGDLVIDLLLVSRAPDGSPWTAVNAREPMHEEVDHLIDQLQPGKTWPEGEMDLILRIERLANKGRRWWPTQPRKGETIHGVTVGERGNQAEECALCGLPVVSGRDDNGNPLLKRDAAGRFFHASCYYDYWRENTGTCQIEGCDRPSHARGWCQGHYSRWRRTGVIGGNVGVA